MNFRSNFVQRRLISKIVHLKQPDNQTKERQKFYQSYIKEGSRPFLNYLFNGFTVS